MTDGSNASNGITVSVVTPCYNGAKYIRDTIASALGQTRPPIDVIVVDDGSTDESAAIAEGFGPPVRVIRQPNQGESVARNRGLAEARGTHVLFLDADDLLAPEALERLTRALQGRAEAVAIMGCAWFRHDPLHPETTRVFSYAGFFPDVIQGNLAPVHCWLAPIAQVRAAGGFLGTLQWFEDWDLWWRVGISGAPLVTVDYIGALYRQHAASQFATISNANRARGHAILTSRMATALLANPPLLAAHGESLFWAGWTALTRARRAGVPWAELEPLSRAVAAVARSGCAGSLPWAVRTVGVRAAHALWDCTRRSDAA